MEIYQEPTEVEAGGRPKTFVSFAARDGPTPTRSGRKPLAAHNFQDGTPLTSSARKLVKEGCVLQGGNTATVKRFAGKTPKKNSPTPMSSTKPTRANKENLTSSVTSPGDRLKSDTSPLPNGQTPNSAQAFRRALRGRPVRDSKSTNDGQAQGSRPANSRLVSFSNLGAARRLGGSSLGGTRSSIGGTGNSLGGTTNLGPPKRVAPKTPNSLLRTELDGDEFSDFAEESLLVSPPGALWNVLGTTDNPESASSTGLMIVSPQAAATIHAITSTAKKLKKMQEENNRSWVSPPLIPRSLDMGSESRVQQKRDSPLVSKEENEKDEAFGSPESHNSPIHTQGGVAMDLSSMFSSQKTRQGRAETKSPMSSPPPNLLQRLQKPTSRSRMVQAGESIKQDHAHTLQKEKGSSISKVPTKAILEKSSSLELSSPQIKVKARSAGVAIDMSEIFSPSMPKDLSGRMPPRLLERLSKSTKHNTKITNESVGKQRPRKSKEPQNETSTREEQVTIQSTKKGNGLSIDMSNLFSTEKSGQKFPRSTPPLHLLKRLEKRSTKSVENRRGKENQPTEHAKEKAKTRSSAARKKPENAVRAKEKPAFQKNRIETKKIQPGRDRRESVSAMRDNDGAPKISRTTTRSHAKMTNPKMPKIQKLTAYSSPKKRNTPSKSNVSKGMKSPMKPLRDAGDWAGKQCDAFASWLNYTFHPTEGDDDISSSKYGGSGLRALVIHRRLAQVRFRATELFHSEPMRKSRNIIQSEIARGRLNIRSDRDIHADLSLRREAIQLLLSYTTPWLRLGLEVMFGECILPENFHIDPEGQMSPVARMRATLKTFVVDRVLSDDSVLMKYTKGRTKVPSGKFEKLYREEMRTLVLYRLMVLILFLDHAKMQNVIDKVPRLFMKGSEVKSSKAVLLSVCRNFLSAEGDFIKHLSRIGLKVSYVQDPIDELEFNVTNLATDLRDGGRLTRMTEIVTEAPFKSIMRSLRLPAISRLQKLHNVNVTLTQLRNHGIFIPDDLNAHHIVDAHREMVLKLMWSVIAHSCMSKLLEDGQVQQEIDNVLWSNKARKKIEGLSSRSSPRLSLEKHYNPDDPPEKIVKALLFRWCKAVCAPFGIKLFDLSQSFSDGKALCYLVHYYHPALIRLDEILPTSFDGVGDITKEQALRNERANSSLAAKRVTELGGIPNMLPITDSSCPPDEKCMLLCLSYLCSRLMESSKEIFATIIIQAYYRKYQQKVLFEKKKVAAWTLYQLWCTHKHKYYAARQRRYRDAVLVLENFVLENKYGLKKLQKARLEKERRVAAAIQIQRCFRGTQGRLYFFKLWTMEQSAIVIQQYVRRYKAQLDLWERLLEKESATQIQRSWRALRLRRIFTKKRISAIAIQCAMRGALVRRRVQRYEYAAMIIQQAWWSWVDYAESQVAAILLQSMWRGFSARRRCNELISRHRATCEIQRVWRGYWQATSYSIARESSICIQKAIRGFQVRLQVPLFRYRKAAVIVQKTWRGFSAQVVFHLNILDIISIQSLVRRRQARRKMQNRVQSIATLQRAWRSALARRELRHLQLCRKKYIELNNAAIVCQCALRVWVSKRQVVFRRSINKASVTIQSSWRSYRQRKVFKGSVHAAISIQTRYRQFLAHKAWKKTSESVLLIQARWRIHAHSKLQHFAATLIQSKWRSIECHRCLERILSSTTCIQRYWRGITARKRYITCINSVVAVQTVWRRYNAMMNYELDLLEIIICQGTVRRMLAQREMERRRRTIQIIQNFFRCSKATMQLRKLQEQQEQYLEQSTAAIKIQMITRRFIVRKSLQREMLAATLLQATCKAWIVGLRFRSLKATVITIQALARGNQQRMIQYQLCENATTIQKAWRRFSASIKYSKAYLSVITVQSVARAWITRLQFRDLKSKVTLFQALVRGYRQRKHQCRKSTGATKIQSAWRRFSAYVRYSVVYFDIVTAQSVARRFLALQVVQKRINSIVVLQSAARRMRDGMLAQRIRIDLQKEKVENDAAKIIQAAYRSFLVRSDLWWKNSQASMIQAAFRGYIARILYTIDCLDIVLVQSIFRRKMAIMKRCERERSVSSIQGAARVWVAKRRLVALAEERRIELEEEAAAFSIQSVFQGYLAKKRFLVERNSAILIQSAFRGHYLRIWYQLYRIDIVILQSVARRWLTERKLERAEWSVLMLQSFARRKMSLRLVASMRHKREIEEERYRASAQIQQCWRSWRTRKIAAEHDAATKIQKTWRCFAAHVDYLVQQISIIRIQATVRRFLGESSFRRTKRGVCRLQAYGRGLNARLYLSFISMAATIIQSSFRKHVQQVRFLRNKNSAILIQKVTRGYIVRDELELSHFAASEIQRAWRGFAQFCDCFVCLESAIKLQSFVRTTNAVRKYNQVKMEILVEQCFLQKKAQIIQRSYRDYVFSKQLSAAASVIQLHARNYIRRRMATRVVRGVTRLQSVFRARLTRRRRNKKVSALARRVVQASRRAKENPKLRIGFKTRYALDVLQKSNSLAEIMDAVKSLETSTRFSNLCCVLFTEANAARILLDLIRSCNRSVPHVELVQHILLTLDNVSKHRSLVPSFADCNSAEIFLDKMQMFRDKDGIFCLSVSLLQCIASCNPAVEEFCAMHEHLKRLKALHQLSLRRARPSSHLKKETKRINRMARRDNFDRNVAVNMLGVLTTNFEKSSLRLSPAHANEARSRFTFDRI